MNNRSLKIDVFACHGLGSIWGALATGIFATTAVNGSGFDGLLYGNTMQLLKQLVGVLSVSAFTFGATYGIGKLVDVVIGLREGQAEETVGLDLSQHGAKAYGGLLR
jgi:Amt family ammonium transporter